MGKAGKSSLYRIQLNEKLTSDSQINQFAHNRQNQQGGTYE